MPFQVFDGHNDFLFRMMNAGQGRKALFQIGLGALHLDLPRMREANFAGGFFAIWVPSPEEDNGLDFEQMMDNPPYDLPLPAPLSVRDAQPIAMEQAAILLEMERLSEGALQVCRTGAEVAKAVANGKIAAIMHMEGAEAIGPDLAQLHLWHQMGLRSLGPVWSRPTIFGEGVPFSYPSSPDRGEGLTDLGVQLVSECDALGILIDLSHLNEKGFDDVARVSSQPLMATHSNAHAVTPSARNLTDRQLAMIAESGGVVGLNFACAFLRDDGRRDTDTPIEAMARHYEHLLKHLGEDQVVLGSDFDGAAVPDFIGDVRGVQRLLSGLMDLGFGQELMEKLASRNWLNFLQKHM